MNGEDKSKVDELSETLYSRTRYKEPEDGRTGVEQSDTPPVQENWEDSPNLDEMLKVERRQPEKSPVMKKIFLSALGFFVLALGIAAYIFLAGSNFVSSKNVDIQITGPTSISAGDVLELGITVENDNNAALEVANMSIQYPPGTRADSEEGESLTYMREELGRIGAGREVTRNARAILFGEEGQLSEIKVTIEYKVEGSSATFYKEKIYEIAIGDTPVTLSVSQPVTVTSGEEFNTVIELTSNSPEILRGIVVRAEYPYGYGVLDATPAAGGENNLWTVGDLAPGDKKTITLRGKLLGENEEERTFRFYAGVSEPGSASQTFATTLTSFSETVGISRPSVVLDLELNGRDTNPYIVPAARPITSSIRFQNNMTDKLLNPRLEVRFSGNALDKFSVNTQGGGFYDSQKNAIVWDISSDGAAELVSGGVGSASFSFSSADNLSGSGTQEITLEVSLTGTALEDGRQRQVTVTETQRVRIASEVALSSRTLYSQGPFTNSGPVPPVAEQETTYTVVWNVTNTTNAIAGAKVSARLGQNVTWLSSGSEELSYDQSTNTVTWTLGSLDADTGISSAGREAAFQVAFTPSIGQVGTVPILVNNIAFSGTDSFTGQLVNVTNSPLTTRISTDSSYTQGDELVSS